jgi:hypothetical protein
MQHDHVKRARVISYVVLSLLLVGTGVAAWLGVDSSPHRTPGLLQKIRHSTIEAQTAGFLELSSQRTLRTSGSRAGVASRVFSLSAVGSVDFGSDEVAVRTRVNQVGQPEQCDESYFVPGSLYQRTEGFCRLPFSRWTVQPSAIDPMLSVPGLSVLTTGFPAVPRRVRGEQSSGSQWIEYRLVSDVDVVCSVPGASRTERLMSRTTIWVDHHDVLRRVNQVEQVWITSRRPRMTQHLVTENSLTLSGFGSRMLFKPPTNLPRLPGPSPSPPSPSPSSNPRCRTFASG